MDKVVRTLKPSTHELTQIQQNLGRPLQGMLDLLHASTVTLPTAPAVTNSQGQVTKPALAGNLNVPGTLTTGTAPTKDTSGNTTKAGAYPGATIRGTLQVLGPNESVGVTADGLGNLQGKYITATQSIYALSGTVSANTMASKSGFLYRQYMGSVWHSTASANQAIDCVHLVYNVANGSMGTTLALSKKTRNGSLVGWSLNQAGAVSGTNSIILLKNGVSWITISVGAGGNNATFWGAYSKGAYAYSAGDTIRCQVANSAAGNTQACLYLDFEETA